MLLGIFKVVLFLRDRHIPMWQSQENVNVFSTSKPFEKTGVPFLVESNIKSATFPYKTALTCQKLKLRRIEWGVQNLKEWGFASSYFLILKILL